MIFQGRNDELKKLLDNQMKIYSKHQKYEQALVLRVLQDEYHGGKLTEVQMPFSQNQLYLEQRYIYLIYPWQIHQSL